MDKPVCKLIGENGNIFNLLVIASRTLKENDFTSQAEEMSKRIMGGEAHSYDEALRVIMEYVNIQ